CMDGVEDANSPKNPPEYSNGDSCSLCDELALSGRPFCAEHEAGLAAFIEEAAPIAAEMGLTVVANGPADRPRPLPASAPYEDPATGRVLSPASRLKGADGAKKPARKRAKK